MLASSAGVRESATSDDGGTRSALTPLLPSQATKSMIGLRTETNNLWGGASQSIIRAGAATEAFLGIISPNTICSTTTKMRAIVPAMPCLIVPPRPSTAFCKMLAMADSATKPSTTEVRLMPSCAPASCRPRSPVAAKASRARRLPVSAMRSRGGRGAATRANSTATKKPLATMSAAASRS